MKSLFSVFKSKKQESNGSAHDEMGSNNQNSNFEYEPVSDGVYVSSDEQNSMNQSMSQNDYNDSDINLQDFVDKAQAYLNSGSQALSEAEEKTAQLEEMDPESIEYDDLVDEVKSLQAKAGYDFKQAQTLIKTANSLKDQEMADAQQ